MTEPDLPDELLARFLNGEANAADRVAVETWAAERPEHRALLDQLLSATARPGPGAWDVDRAWTKVAELVRKTDEPVMVLPLRRPAWRATLLRIAAAVVVVFGVIFAWRQLDRVAAPVVYATSLGERLELTLDDGTVAVLGPWSTLTVPANFGAGARQVSLDGAGWFQAADDSLAFEVRSGEYLVRDIGTVFTVAQRTDAPLRVTVVEGEVQVRMAADTGTLLASLTSGDVADFSRPDSTLEPEPVIAREQPVAAMASWRTGTLELVDTPVQEVIERLAVWHGVTISVAPALAQDRTITASLPLGSLDQALDILAPLLGAQVVRGAGTIRLQ